MFDLDAPYTIIFFANGTAAVCNARGQMPKYQVGCHQDTIAALEADDIDWRRIPEILGSPQQGRPAWLTERERRAAT